MVAEQDAMRRPFRLGATAARALRVVSWLIAAMLPVLPAVAQQGIPSCAPRGYGYGPFDYRKFDRHQTEIPGHNLYLVEIAHFTPQVEALIRGQSTIDPGPDIDYALRAFPNHPRALLAMTRLGERQKTDQPSGAQVSVECYYARAIQFTPDDIVIRMLYSIYLNKHGRRQDSLVQLGVARTLTGDDGFSHYNLGLAYLDAGAVDLALTEAQRALALGFTRQGLKQKLVAMGKWKDPPPAPAASAASAH